MSSIVKDMGNKESIKLAQQNTGNMSSTRDADIPKPTASVRGLENFKPNFQRAHKPSASQSSQIKGRNQSPIQNDKKKLDENHSQETTVQQPTTLSFPNTFNQDVVPQARENVLQNYASLQQPVFNPSGYVNGNTVFPGQMIPPMLVQQPMQVPSAIPGMFQTGFMYQTLTPGSAKPYHANSHFFPPFTKGSLIMLATGNLKPIEELKTVDFVESAKVSKQLLLETSKIAKIQEMPNSTMSLIGFAVDNYESEVLVEKPSDHPFFIYEQGWASCKPDITLSRYGLQCQQLKIGDVCVFLSNKLETRSDRTLDCDTKSGVEDKERQTHVNHYNTTLVPKTNEPSDAVRASETGESGGIDTRTQLKSFGKEEKEVGHGFGQPVGKKPKLDIPSEK